MDINMPAVESIFPPYDNVAIVLFKLDNKTIDFSMATRFLLIFGTDTVDTAIDPTAITTTLIEGELKFKLGGLVLTSAGLQQATLVVFDSANPNGQLITCNGDNILSFDIKAC